MWLFVWIVCLFGLLFVDLDIWSLLIVTCSFGWCVVWVVRFCVFVLVWLAW